MELYCHESFAKEIMNIAKKFKVDSKVIGQCEKSSKQNKNIVEIKSELGSFSYGENE